MLFIFLDVFMALPYSIASYKEENQNTKMESVALELGDQPSKHTSNSAMENPVSLFTEVVRHSNHSRLCYATERIGDSFGFECEPKTVYDDYNIDRIPQLLPQIKCKSRVPSTDILNNRIGFECEEVEHFIPVMFQINKTMNFKWRFSSISTGCIKVKTPILMEERKADSVISAISDELSKHVSNNAMEKPVSLLTEVVRHTNHSGLCYPPERIGDSFGFECEPKTVYDYKIDRIPQLLPQVTCKSRVPSTDVLNNRIGFECEAVMYLVPVMYQTSDALRFKWTFNRISTDCIKVKTPRVKN